MDIIITCEDYIEAALIVIPITCGIIFGIVIIGLVNRWARAGEPEADQDLYVIPEQYCSKPVTPEWQNTTYTYKQRMELFN